MKVLIERKRHLVVKLYEYSTNNVFSFDGGGDINF